MEHVDELIAAHALRALDPDDERAVEQHLAECEGCRHKLAEFEAVAAALAYAAPAAAPPLELRDRILGAAEPVVQPPVPPPVRERRRWWPRIAAVAAPGFAVLAIALAAWNISLRNDLGDTRSRFATGRVIHLANVGNVVTSGGSAILYADLKPAPSGKTYEAWVITGGKPVPAGTFDGGTGTRLTLTHDVAAGDSVAVTVEPEGGSAQPTSEPLAVGASNLG